MQTSESSDRTDRIAGMEDDLLRENDLTLKQHNAFKHGRPGEKLTQSSSIEFMVGTRVPFSAYYANVTKAFEPAVAYAIKLPIHMYSVASLTIICPDGGEQNDIALN